MIARLRRLDPAMVRLIGFVAALAALAAILVFAGRVFLPLILGLALAYLLDPAVSWLERRGWSRAVGTSVIAIAVALAVVLFFVVLAPILVGQARELVHRLPEYRAEIESRIRPLLDRLQTDYPAQFDEVRGRIEQIVQERWPQMLESAAGWLGGAFSSLLGFLLFLLDLIFVPVFAFYLLVDFPKLKSGALSLVPVPYRAITISRLGEVNAAVSSFLRGQLTIAMILAAINGVGLTLVGVPLGLLVGIVAGLANMIPYMALVIGLAPALLLVWIEHQSVPRLIAVAAIFTGAQMLEGTVLSPRILSKEVNLHPVWVLLAIIVGGRFFGLVGMLVAVPVTAAMQVFVKHWLVAYRASSAYLGEPVGVPRSAGPRVEPPES
jgi:predicted PurR-regulated permease PerM